MNSLVHRGFVDQELMQYDVIVELVNGEKRYCTTEVPSSWEYDYVVRNITSLFEDRKFVRVAENVVVNSSNVLTITINTNDEQFEPYNFSL
ncbi:MAG: hypothetical protein ACE3JP_08290 [Ectobacillus sp.]